MPGLLTTSDVAAGIVFSIFFRDQSLTGILVSRYYYTVMPVRFPERIDPLFLIRTKQRFQGALPLSKMQRLTELLYDTEGEATFDLSFRLEGRVPSVIGHVSANLALQCQSCLKLIRSVIEREVNLGVVASIDEASLLPEPYEPLLIENEKMALCDLVEDELILGLPLIARHSVCEMAAAPSEEESSPKEKPFAILAELRKTGGK